MGRVLISLRVIRGTHLPPLNNFSPWDQFIPADMVIGKILPIDQVVDDFYVIDPVVPNVKDSFP